MSSETFKVNLAYEFERSLAEQATQEVMAKMATDAADPDVVTMGKKGIFRTATFTKIFNRTFEPLGVHFSGWYGDAYLIESDRAPEEIQAACPQFTCVGAYPAKQ